MSQLWIPMSGGLVLSISALACARRGLNLPPVQRGSQVTCFLPGLALPEPGLATDLSSQQLRAPAVGPQPGRVACRGGVSWILKLDWDLHLIIATTGTSPAIKQQHQHWPRLVDNACLHLAVVQNKKFAKIPNELVATMQFKYYWLGVDIMAQFSRITTPYYWTPSQKVKYARFVVTKRGNI